jgi:hypothetical protein
MQDSDDLVAHERAYHAFNVLLRWSMVHLASIIVWLTLWFATDAGFIGATVVGLIVFAVGYVVLVRHEEHQPLDPWAQGR